MNIDSKQLLFLPPLARAVTLGVTLFVLGAALMVALSMPNVASGARTLRVSRLGRPQRAPYFRDLFVAAGDRGAGYLDELKRVFQFTPAAPRQ